MTKRRASQSKGMLFTGGMLVGLIFLFLVPRDASGRLQLAYARVFRWPLTLGGGVVRVSHTTSQARTVSPKEHAEALQAVQQLRNQSANLQAQLQEATRQIELLTRLKARPGLERMQPIPAKVIMRVQDELTIGQGLESGVAVGQYVLSLTEARIDEQSVIGVVSAVYAKVATVKLLTDPTLRLPVGLAGLSVPKLMVGRGDGTARITLVPREHTIRAGDAVYAEKRPGILDVPVIAAEVVQCRPDTKDPLMWDISVRPVCDLATLSDVVVMKASAP